MSAVDTASWTINQHLTIYGQKYIIKRWRHACILYHSSLRIGHIGHKEIKVTYGTYVVNDQVTYWHEQMTIWQHSNQMGCSCTWQRSLSCETNTGATEEVPGPNQSWRGCNHRLRIGHTKATKSHILSRGPPTGCLHCGQTLTIDHMLTECALLQECRDEYYTFDSLNAVFETIPETYIVEFLWEAGFFYLIWCNLSTSTSPQTWTIWSELSNYLENESNSETHLHV